MAIAYISSAQANSASSQVSSEAITIPAGYVAGSACFLLFQSYSGSGGPSTLTVTSTGSTWTQLGSTVYVAGTSSQNNASLWYLEAASTDAGKVVTVHTSVSNFVNATMVAYSGAATSFIDVSNVASTATLSSTAPMPSVNTVAANDWAIYVAAICNGSAGFSAPTTTGITNRFANIGSDSGIAAIGDSNGSVGAGGTTIGGAGLLYTPSSTGDYVTWTVGLAPVLVPSGTTAYIPLFPPGLQSPAGWAPLTVSQTSVPLVNAYDSTGALGTGAAYNPVAQVTALPAAALGTGAVPPNVVIQAAPTVEMATGSLPGTVSTTVTLPQATGTGNTLVACITAGGNIAAPTVSGVTLGGSADNWRPAATDTSNVSIFGGAIWYDPNAAAGQTSVVVSFTGGSGASGDTYVAVYEVPGILAADQASHGDSGSTVTTWSSGATSATAQANEIFFGVSSASNAIPVVTGAGTWITQSTGAGIWDQVSGYRFVSASGTAAFSGTLPGGGGLYSALVATLAIPSPNAQVTAIPATAAGTGAAYNPVAQVTAKPAAALGTGAAYAPFISYTAGAALGTGTAYNPVAQVTALPAAALGTGTAYNPVAQVTALPGAATGTGAANKPGWGPGTTTAAGTGAAYLPGWGPGTAAAAGTGAAYLPGWGPGTTTAAGTGAAYQPALGPATAAGTAVAYLPGWGPGTTTAAGTGAALKPAWGPGTTGAAAGTGAAYNPVAQVTAKPAAALGTGAAYNPVAQVTALPAAAPGTGTAYAPFISYTAGAALGTGTAGKPGWGPGTTAAAGAGAAYNPVAQVTAFDQTGALGTGTAYNIPFHADNTVFPGVAAGTGNTYLAGWGPVYDISAATGTAYGGDTAPGFAQVTALPGAALGTGAAYVLTAGFAPGAAIASGDVFQPYISYTAGAALGTAAAGKPGWGPVAGVAAGTGAGYTVALVKLTVFPGAAPATAVAYGTVELSPALEGYGFGTFPQVPNGAIILSVVADVVWTGSNTGIQAPAYELWNGVSARIGAPVTGVASTTAGHRDSVVFTGVVYSQLATLRLRVYAASLLSNAGATASFDAVSLSVAWAPNTNAATAPVTLTVVPVFPAVSVSNGITITPAVAVAAGTAGQPVGTGNIGATALPGVLVIIPVFPAVRISIGQTITPGVLAIVPLLPLIIDITGPGWAASDDQPVGGTGSWVNPGNITGPPDGSVAVWTSV